MAENSISSEVKEVVKIDHKKTKRGDLMLFCYWGTIDAVRQGGRELSVCGLKEAPEHFTVNGLPVIESAFSADQHAKEVVLSRTKVLEIFVQSHNRPFTVEFVKKDGTARTLRGLLLGPVPNEGRSYVEDLDVKEGSTVREVDHRTIKSLVVEGVKYTVK